MILATVVARVSGAAASSRGPPWFYAGTPEIERLADVSLLPRGVDPAARPWLVEFFAPWCGHCMAFREPFRAAAVRLGESAPILRVAAVDCVAYPAECTRSAVKGYPTLRLYGVAVGEDTFTGRHTVDGVHDWAIAELLASRWAKPPMAATWPELRRVLSATVGGAPRAAPRAVVVLVAPRRGVEAERESIGRLTLRWAARLPLVLWASEERLPLPVPADEAAGDSGEIALWLVTANGTSPPRRLPSQVVTGSPSEATSALRRVEGLLLDKDGGRTAREGKGEEEGAVAPRDALPGDALPVSNAAAAVTAARAAVAFWLHTALFAGESTLEGARAARAASIITVIGRLGGDMAPWRLDELAAVLDAGRPLNADAWQKLLRAHGVGPQPNLDGDDVGLLWGPICGPSASPFTCGLWVLLHAVSLRGPVGKGGCREAMDAVEHLVDSFFGCATCREHFLAMLQRDRESLERTKSPDGCQANFGLWLWRAHNEVNSRLSAAESTRATRPKPLRPTGAECQRCRQGDRWDEAEVERWLAAVYCASGQPCALPETMWTRPPSRHGGDGSAHTGIRRGSQFASVQAPAAAALLVAVALAAVCCRCPGRARGTASGAPRSSLTKAV